ncbi:hypothetical protein, partial [Cylindrospermopsis raciborskii]|uniref:hypothetical protein n=1 Tax=Cylindrospermopsis raciborskii TaxID=77022 RepID=UPI001F1F678A
TECDYSILTKRSLFTLSPSTTGFIVFLTLLIFSPFTKERSPFTLCPITAPRDFWGLNTGCEHSIPTKRSLFLLSPSYYSTTGFLEIEYWM